MVIRVLVEGGLLVNEIDAEKSKINRTLTGSEVLREQLRKFFEKVLDTDDISVIVSYEGGNKNAAKEFINKGQNSYLYTDLDDLPENRAKWFDKMSSDGICIPDEQKSNVYFWIQEKEAWFLKQPDCIEKWANSMSVKVKKSVADDPLIKGKDIERLKQKPSRIMKVIFKRCLLNNHIDKNGKPKKMEYGKLRHAPNIIAYIDANDLINKDKELRDFVGAVKLKISSCDHVPLSTYYPL